MASNPELFEGLESSFQGPGVGAHGAIQKPAAVLRKIRMPTELEPDRAASPSGGYLHGSHLHPWRRTEGTLAYLQEHPEDDTVHVVMG